MLSEEVGEIIGIDTRDEMGMISMPTDTKVQYRARERLFVSIILRIEVMFDYC